MITVIIKTIFIMLSLLLLLASANDFNGKDNHYAYITVIFLELIVIIFMI